MPKTHSAQISLPHMRDLIILLTIWHSSHFLTLHFSIFLPVIFWISWAVYRRRKTYCKEMYYKTNSVQILIHWHDTDSYVHYFSTKTSLQHLHGSKNTMVFMSMEAWLLSVAKVLSVRQTDLWFLDSPVLTLQIQSLCSHEKWLPVSDWQNHEQSCP